MLGRLISCLPDSSLTAIVWICFRCFLTHLVKLFLLVCLFYTHFGQWELPYKKMVNWLIINDFQFMVDLYLRLHYKLRLKFVKERIASEMILYFLFKSLIKLRGFLKLHFSTMWKTTAKVYTFMIIILCYWRLVIHFWIEIFIHMFQLKWLIAKTKF